MIWEHWLVAISIGIIALAFVVLVIFVILALLSIRQTLDDLDQKIHAFDPLFRVLSKAGKVMEMKASEQLEEVEQSVYEKRREPKSRNAVDTAMEVAEWALVGLSLWQKIREKRR